jgi:hypothetical protein
VSRKSVVSKLASAAIPNRLDRHFWLITAILLAIMGASQFGSAIRESPTNDEATHLTAGYIYLTTGEYGMDLSHPPLGRVLAALPLLALPLRRIPPDKAWLNLGTLIWDNPVPPATVILYARLVVIALTLLFGAWLSWWTRGQFGASVALLALSFFIFDPNIVAHGHYVTTDLIASFGIFLACTLWADFLQEPSSKTLILAVGALGFALISKFSALFLLIVLPLLYGVAWRWKRGQRFFTLRGAIGVLLFTIVGVSVCIALAYAPATMVQAHSSWAAKDRTPASSDGTVQSVQLSVAVRRAISELQSVTRPSSFGYIQGLNQLLKHNSEGNPAYLVGQFSPSGWWQYFPVAFLVKTPTGTLLACLLAAASLFYFRRQTVPVLPLACVALPPAIYFLIAMRSSIDIGVRHILPVYSFLYVFLSFVLIRYGSYLFGRSGPFAIAALIVLTCTESLLSYPHYLAFFNWPSGGPANGSHYLLDSNLDWGQDTDNLRTYVLRTGSTPLCTALFGNTPRNYFGTGSRDLFTTGTPEGLENLNCVVAVSVNFVKGLYVGPEEFATLRRQEPFAKVGFSIYLYDLRH